MACVGDAGVESGDVVTPQRSQRSFAKNGKECNVLLQRTEKTARTFRSFAKERENVPFFFQYIYRYI